MKLNFMCLQKLSNEWVKILLLILEEVVLTILGRSFSADTFYRTPVSVEKVDDFDNGKCCNYHFLVETPISETKPRKKSMRTSLVEYGDILILIGNFP